MPKRDIMKELSLDTINIAISAIGVWRGQLKREGQHLESPRFFRDTAKAKTELFNLRRKLYLPS